MSDLIQRIEALEAVSHRLDATQLKMQEVLPMVIEMIKDDCNKEAIIDRIDGLLNFCQIPRKVEPEVIEEPLQEFHLECVALEPNLYGVTVTARSEEEAIALVRKHGISSPAGYHDNDGSNPENKPVYCYGFIENANGGWDEKTASIEQETFNDAVWGITHVSINN